MSLEFKSGQLIKMGKFREAIPMFYDEIHMAMEAGVTNPNEYLGLAEEFSRILLNPSNFDEVQMLGDKMLKLMMRIPGYLPTVSKEEFYNNIKLNYETFELKDQ